MAIELPLTVRLFGTDEPVSKPIVLSAGRLEQSVSIDVSGPITTKRERSAAISVKLGTGLGPAPALGLGLDPDEIQATRSLAATLAQLRPRHVICHYDPRRGHDRHTLEELAALAVSLGAVPWLEAVIAGVAWSIGYFAHFARSGFEAITLGSTTGPFGVVHTPQEWQTPGYEEDGGLYPIFHALRGLAALYRKRMITFETSDPTKIQGVCIEDSEGAELWIANLTPELLGLMLPRPMRTFATLDSDSFMAGACAPQYLDELRPWPDVSTLSLSSFALARICLA
jgi:hypothetical protein